MFTQEQIKEIREKLALEGSKDKSLPLADLPLSGKEIIALVQDGKNKRVPIEEFYEEFSRYIDNSERVDFFNVSRYAQRIVDINGSVPMTLGEAINICPFDVRRSGQVITFVDHDGVWAIWQFTSNDPSDWEDINKCWHNLDATPNLGIIVEPSIASLEVGNTEEVTIHFNTIDGGDAETVELYIDDNLVNTYHDVKEFDYKRVIANPTKITVKASQYGITYEEECNITTIYPAWIGAGINNSQIITSNNEVYVEDSIEGTFEVTFDETSYLIIIVPSLITLNPVIMNGFEVPMQEPSEITYKRTKYTVYKSINKYIAGSYKFTIGTYEGNEKELITALQQSVAGVNTLINEQSEVNNDQSKTISNIEIGLTEIETGLTEIEEKLNNVESTIATVDKEDITIVDGIYKFANKDFDAQLFSGKGRIYLRKNWSNIVKEIEGERQKVRVNLLTQSMISTTNSIYILQYDYTLNEHTITLPQGAVLQYAGGSIDDGTLDITGATLLPGWENLIGENLEITGIPAAGTMYITQDSVAISNGESWFNLSIMESQDIELLD